MFDHILMRPERLDRRAGSPHPGLRPGLSLKLEDGHACGMRFTVTRRPGPV